MSGFELGRLRLRRNARAIWHVNAAAAFGFAILALGVWVLLLDGVVAPTGIVLLLTGIALVVIAAAIESALGHRRKE